MTGPSDLLVRSKHVIQQEELDMSARVLLNPV